MRHLRCRPGRPRHYRYRPSVQPFRDNRQPQCRSPAQAETRFSPNERRPRRSRGESRWEGRGCPRQCRERNSNRAPLTPAASIARVHARNFCLTTEGQAFSHRYVLIKDVPSPCSGEELRIIELFTRWRNGRGSLLPGAMWCNGRRLHRLGLWLRRRVWYRLLL